MASKAPTEAGIKALQSREIRCCVSLGAGCSFVKRML